jgi:beta-glucanase (GH16 family)
MNNQDKSVHHSQAKTFRAITAGLLLACSAHGFAGVTNPVIGKLLWAEEFNDATLNTARWTPTNGNGCEIGLCGFGNQELQFYRPNNVSIDNVPFETGTRALALKALRETVGTNPFTSGKITTEGKVQIQYGMVEIRMSAPSIDTGLWPAAWMLGVSPQVWPRKGEIDIMEQGHKAAGRAAAGSPTPSANNFVGANVITYESAACVPGNESCAASSAWQTKNWYVPTVSLANRFVKYRLYWTNTEIRFTAIDNNVETDLYDRPLAVTNPALRAPYYLLLNLAVGGNFTDSANAGAVTSPLPATMYVDYIRVYELDGKGSVKLGNQNVPKVGTVGVFTDLTKVTSKQVAGASSDIFVWNQNSTSAGNTAPAEGSNVIALSYNTPNQWFGAGINSRQVHDMSNFRQNGTLKFKIKMPANVAFRVGVQDTYTNQNSVLFPANTTAYGLVRNGEWGTATIPVAELAGPSVALQSMLELFQITSNPGAFPNAAFQFAIDDIIWDSGVKVGPEDSTGVLQTSASHVKFSVIDTRWADLHVTINNGPERFVIIKGVRSNLRMHQQGNKSTYSIGGLRANDVVRYYFTYGSAGNNSEVTTPLQTYTVR